MDKKEDRQLNIPTTKFFKKKMKCAVAKNEFSFFAGKLDVLAYNSTEKCFHISEGKRSGNIASIGHAIGQLIAYMSMIQERGYDFLDQISKGERLELSDFSSFLEDKSIRACFYVTLPIEKKDKLFAPAKLMLKNLGDFGSSIGIFFANSKKCELTIPAKPVIIKIRRIYDREGFLKEIADKFFQQTISDGLVVWETSWNHLIQIKEKIGNPYLHFEITIRRRRKKEETNTTEIAFHLEFAKSHLKHSVTNKRKLKLQSIMKKSLKELRKKEKDFKLQLEWGKNWSKLYSIYKTSGTKFDNEDLSEVLRRLVILVSILKPKFDDINWGRNKMLKEVNPV